MASEMMKTAYHAVHGATSMYNVDALAAVAKFPEEWSLTPWTAAEISAARAAFVARHKEDTEAAKAAGLPLPPPLPPEIDPSPRQKVELSADAKARLEAAERLKAQAEKDEKARKEAEQLAADKALVNSPPPQIDPNERRPFGRPGVMTPAEQQAADKARSDAAAKAKPDADKAKASAPTPLHVAKPGDKPT